MKDYLEETISALTDKELKNLEGLIELAGQRIEVDIRGTEKPS
jgi:hypothetical protein